MILKNRLSPAGTRPIVCIDEAQVSCYYYFNVVMGSQPINHKVLDPNLGWSDFRSNYGRSYGRSDYYLIHRTWIAKTSCYTRPVFITCLMCSCRASEESLTTNLGDYKYQDTGEQFSLNEYIPDSSMNDVPIVISCTDAAVLQCIQ